MTTVIKLEKNTDPFFGKNTWNVIYITDADKDKNGNPFIIKSCGWKTKKSAIYEQVSVWYGQSSDVTDLTLEGTTVDEINYIKAAHC